MIAGNARQASPSQEAVPSVNRNPQELWVLWINYPGLFFPSQNNLLFGSWDWVMWNMWKGLPRRLIFLIECGASNAMSGPRALKTRASGPDPASRTRKRISATCETPVSLPEYAVVVHWRNVKLEVIGRREILSALGLIIGLASLLGLKLLL
jgi:hypothetical protein